MDPSTGLSARFLNAIKEWPLWLLVAVALSLTVFVAVPAFRDLASPPVRVCEGRFTAETGQ